jgi:hypothetical protein
MKVKAAIETLSKWFDPDDDIVIDWFEKDDFFYVNDQEIDDELWEDTCYRAEDSEYLMDRDVVEIIMRAIQHEQRRVNNE